VILATVHLLRAVALALRDERTRALLGLTVVVIAGGTAFYALQEGWSVVDALYFTVMTLATVGYGDLVPTSDVAKLFTVVYTLIGIGLLASTIAALAAAAIDARHERRTRRV
jgi:hypothetical protein